jgi:hypothetical protein
MSTNTLQSPVRPSTIAAPGSYVIVSTYARQYRAFVTRVFVDALGEHVFEGFECKPGTRVYLRDENGPRFVSGYVDQVIETV